MLLANNQYNTLEPIVLNNSDTCDILSTRIDKIQQMYTNPNEPKIHDIDGGNLEGCFPSINVIAMNSIIAKTASPIYVHENPICL